MKLPIPIPIKKQVRSGRSSFYNDIRKASSGNKIIVFSHLPWDSVTQRPHHIIRRLSQHYQILFIEEPIATTGVKPRHTTSQVEKNIARMRIYGTWETMVTHMPKWLTKLGFGVKAGPILWFYSPSFVSAIHTVSHCLAIYDCMDELSAFQGASTTLSIQEKQLFTHVDIVFTGGRSLFREKQKYHQEVYCFPSSVDSKHFAQALGRRTQIPDDIKDLPYPIVGFYGVLDERLDRELLAKIAQALPRVSFVLLGPTVKISPSCLPQSPNIYYLGKKNYQDLPKYLKAFDIAFMPFALNEATRFISPTKTLEFMAAYKPIISTPIYDVVHEYGPEVTIAHSVREMKQAIRYFMHEPRNEKAARIALARERLQKTSWDTTVKEMMTIMEQKIAENSIGETSDISLPVLSHQLSVSFAYEQSS